jgi:plastocyanin
MAPSRRLVVVLSSISIALAACGDDDEASSSGTSSAEVEIESSRFSAKETAVDPGGVVTFRNLDPFAHTVTSHEASPLEFDSGELGQDATFDVTFPDAGSFDYFCRIHPTMRAKVVVA